MPIREIVFFAGCASIVVAIVGGSISAKGVSVGAINLRRSVVLGAFGILLCAAAFSAPLDKLVAETVTINNLPQQPSMYAKGAPSEVVRSAETDAEAITIGGADIRFPSSSVIAVTDHDLENSELVTTVIGITPAMARIKGSVSDFLSSLHNKADFFSLSTISGYEIWINARRIKSIQKAVPGKYAPTVKTVIAAGGLNLGVNFDIDSVRALANSHGGSFK